MNVHLRGHYEIIGEVDVSNKLHRYRFHVPLEKDILVTVDLNLAEKSAESSYEVVISTELYGYLQSKEPGLPPDLQDELIAISANLGAAARRVLSLVKFCFNWVKLDERLLANKGRSWSIDRASWTPLPQQVNTTMELYGLQTLNEETGQAIQECLDLGFEPFLALRHLHRARAERIPRYRWIEATIAAELAIKEFLISFNPEIESLLLEIPAPPLHKLYGSILESFTGERSPKVSAIARGVERRNKLIHRPVESRVDHQEAADYVSDVETAIYHLIHLLHGDNRSVKSFFLYWPEGA